MKCAIKLSLAEGCWRGLGMPIDLATPDSGMPHPPTVTALLSLPLLPGVVSVSATVCAHHLIISCSGAISWPTTECVWCKYTYKHISHLLHANEATIISLTMRISCRLLVVFVWVLNIFHITLPQLGTYRIESRILGKRIAAILGWAESPPWYYVHFAIQ